MAAKLILSLAVCFFLTLVDVQGQLQTVNGRIKITVGTTSACSDTVRFMSSLVETYNLYKQFLDIEFIPWGRTVRNADGSLTCQFGVNDCWANRLHRCVLNKLQGNVEAQVNYMSCEFLSSPLPGFQLGSYICAHHAGLSLVDVDYCTNNPNDEIDFEAERRGLVLTQQINFIPSIVFNDQADLELHSQGFNQLASMVCFALAADSTTGVTNCSLAP